MSTPPQSHATQLADAAARWIATLPAEHRQVAVWPFGSSERGDWHYAPRARGGLALRAMSEPQREAARALLAQGLSRQGETKARAIMALETVLAEIEGGRGHVRDPLNYAFTLFGDPERPPWGWRVEGHHLIVNVAVAPSGAVAVTPTFWGSNPARVPHGPHEGERVQAVEYHLGLELARSLSATQRRDAVIASRSIGNIVTERGRAQALTHPSGLACSELDDGQRGVLTTVLDAYLGNMPDEVVAPYRRRVLGRLGELHLAWAGGMAEAEPFSYRLHGPRLLVELDCTPDDANHIHSLWRDPAGDWGRDILGEHYRRHHDTD